MQFHDITREVFDAQYDASVSRLFAKYALELDYEDLPAEVVHQAKRSLLDTLGCAIGGYDAPGRVSCEELVQQLGGREQATVFGSGTKTSAPNAALVNSFMVRYLDYNDLGGGGHGSDGIPGILAVAEKENATGKELLTSIVVSYELGARFQESVGETGSLRQKGWTIDVRGGLNMPPAIGRLMGLTEGQIANAIGCCASRNLPLKILDSHGEELTMTKNIRFGSVTRDAIISCMLAENGFTGPIRVVEGDKGMREVLLDGEMEIERLVDFSGWRMVDTMYKTLPVNGTTHGNVWATIHIVEEYDLEPEDIESVRIGVGERTCKHTAGLSRRYPRNGETADHSAYFANAYAIKERDVDPEAFKEDNLSDPVILDLIEKITVEPDPDVPEWSRQGISEITTTDGNSYRKHVKRPPGVVTPLTDEELEEKFVDMASKYMDDDRAETLIDRVWAVEELDELDGLLEPMKFD